jgi:hypothetical protein
MKIGWSIARKIITAFAYIKLRAEFLLNWSLKTLLFEIRGCVMVLHCHVILIYLFTACFDLTRPSSGILTK